MMTLFVHNEDEDLMTCMTSMIVNHQRIHFFGVLMTLVEYKYWWTDDEHYLIDVVQQHYILNKMKRQSIIQIIFARIITHISKNISNTAPNKILQYHNMLVSQYSKLDANLKRRE